MPLYRHSYWPRVLQSLASENATVNALLAWGHARAIENLMERKNFMNPPPVRAISDQFARSKSTVARALVGRARD